MPKKDARTLVARFNEQIEPIYALLRETEDVNLAYEILEPEPTEIPALKQRWERAWSFLTALLPCRVFLCSALWGFPKPCAGLTCTAPTMQTADRLPQGCVVYKETEGCNHFLLNSPLHVFFYEVGCLNCMLLAMLQLVCTPSPWPNS